MNFLKSITLGLGLTGLLLMSSCAGESSKTTTGETAKTADGAGNPVKSRPTPNKNTNQNAANNAQEKGEVKWVSIHDIEAFTEKEKRKVMIDLYTSWCGWCKRMDKSTFQNPEIAQYLNDNFYAVKFDAESKELIPFKGKEHKFVQAGRRGYNELAHSFASGRMSYPTIAFLDENLERINSFPGFKQPSQFDPLLHYIKEEHYTTKTLAQFQTTFKSNLPSGDSRVKGGEPKIKLK